MSGQRGHLVPRDTKAQLLGFLDALLTPGQRRLPPDEFRRYRVLVGAALLNFLLALFLVVAPKPPGHDARFAAVGLLFLVGYLSVLVLVRRGASLRFPALLLCSTLTLGCLTTPALLRDPQPANGAAVMLLPALAAYLVGPRLGLIFTALVGLNALLLHPLYMVGFDLSRPLFPDEAARLVALMTVLSLMGGWFLSWLHGTARDQAHATLEQTLRTLRESEGKLVSLIESTEDSVCSLDMHGRILTANQGARRLLRQVSRAEPSPGDSLLGLFPLAQQARWKEGVAQALGGHPWRFEVNATSEEGPRVLDISLNPILGPEGRTVGATLFGRDITALKEAEARLSELHRNLLDVSRQAGKAEIATGILHNIGNTLTSVNVSVQLVDQGLRALRLSGVDRTAALLEDKAQELGTFLVSDPQGQQLPAYLRALATQLSGEQEALLHEVALLKERVEHVKAVVSMQQEHASAVGVLEQVPVPQLLHDALRLHTAAFKQFDIQVHSEYAAMPPVIVDRHKLLQVLLNLLNNARQSLQASGRPDKQLTLRVESAPGERLRISIADNGVGISPEHLPRLFSAGFTTRKEGHGFGLHISALTAMEMSGTLSCVSAGPGQGATFTIELPLVSRQERS
jgi:PAS domain S-box-containing protein